MDKEKLKKVFDDLIAGDLLSAPGIRGEAIVLRAKEDGSKLIGTVCGNHAHPLPFYLKWDDKLAMPVDPNGEKVIPAWSEISVAKEGNPSLAAKYYDFPIAEDYVTPEVLKLVEKTPREVIERAALINSFSSAGPALTVVAMLRTMGVKIADEQAALVHEVMITQEEHLLGDLGTLLASLGSHLMRGKRENAG